LTVLSAESEGSMSEEMLRMRELRRSSVENSDSSVDVRPFTKYDVVSIATVGSLISSGELPVVFGN
jgi:hypothetical protein